MDQSAGALFAAAAAMDSSEGVRRRSHAGQVVAGAVVAAGIGLFVLWAWQNPAFEWHVFASYFTAKSILVGLGTTLWLTGAVTVLSMLLGIGLAAMRMSANRVLSGVAWFYVWVFRSTPLLVQLLFWFNIGYFVPRFLVHLPWGTFAITSTNLISPTIAALLGLTMHTVAYAGEIIRGGILAVPKGQVEAGQVLGLSRGRVFRRIVLPQSLRSIIPALGNLLIDTLKSTSIVSVLAVADLLYSAQMIYNSNYKIVPLLMVATIWYIVVTTVLSIGQHYIERALSKGFGTAHRTPGPPPALLDEAGQPA